MTDYTRSLSFAGLAGNDSLPAVFDTEFNLVAVASATKADLASPTFSGTVIVPPLPATGETTKAIAAQDVKHYAFTAGTKMAFFQATAPIGWTQDTSNNDAILRVVSAAGGGTGGASAFVGAPLVITNAHTLLISEMPAHTHMAGHSISSQGDTGAPNSGSSQAQSGSTGGNAAHTHGITYVPKYIDMIIAVKD